MPLCPICEEDVPVTCLCGFCLRCIGKHTHTGCYEILEGIRKMEEQKQNE